MAKTDWSLNDVVKPADLNEMGEDINQLRQDVDNMDFPLSDATNGARSDVAGSEKAVGLVMQAVETRETPTGAQSKVDAHANLTSPHGATSAATPSRLIVRDIAGRAKVAAPSASDDIAIKSTVDNAVGTLSGLLTTAKGNAVSAINELFTSASNGKTAVAAAITGKGVPASGSDTFAQLAQKITSIKTGIRGTVMSSSDRRDFWHITSPTGGTVFNDYYVTVNNLGFDPIVVMIYRVPDNINILDDASFYNSVLGRGDLLYSYRYVYDLQNSGHVNNGFLLPVPTGNVTYQWIAY